MWGRRCSGHVDELNIENATCRLLLSDGSHEDNCGICTLLYGSTDCDAEIDLCTESATGKWIPMYGMHFS